MRQNTIPIFEYVINNNILFQKHQTASSQLVSYLGNIAPNSGVNYFFPIFGPLPLNNHWTLLLDIV